METMAREHSIQRVKTLNKKREEERPINKRGQQANKTQLIKK